MHQFGVEDSGTGGATDGVMTQGDEFVIQHRTRAEAADKRRHAALAFGIFARLGTVAFMHIDDRTRRGAGKLAILRHATEVVEGGVQFGQRRLGGQFYGNSDGVAIDHGYAITMRAYGGRQRLDVVAAEFTQDLLGFLLHLFLFAADERNHIGHNVHGSDARITRAGNGLQSGCDHFADAKGFQRSQTHGENDGGAIRISDDLAFPTAEALLARHQFQVIRIDFGDEERDIPLHAMVPGVGYYDVSRLRKRLL